MKNPNLLDVVLLKPEGGKGRELVLEELPVNPELAPYLVTSLQAVTWVPNASKHNTVRAGVRDREGVEADLVAALIQMGSEANWGNVHPLTTQGVQACLDHVSTYLEGPFEALVSAETEGLEDLSLPEGVTPTFAKWIPRDVMVVVPVDRTYLGTLWVLGQQVSALVHNASRGVALAWR